MGSNLAKKASYFSKAFLCETRVRLFVLLLPLFCWGFVWGDMVAIKARIEINTGDSEFLMHHCAWVYLNMPPSFFSWYLTGPLLLLFTTRVEERIDFSSKSAALRISYTRRHSGYRLFPSMYGHNRCVQPSRLYCGTAFFLVVADEWARSCAGLILSLIKTQSRLRVAWLNSDKECCSRRFVTHYSFWNKWRGPSNTSMHALQMSKCWSWRSFVSVKLANSLKINMFLSFFPPTSLFSKKWRHIMAASHFPLVIMWRDQINPIRIWAAGTDSVLTCGSSNPVIPTFCASLSEDTDKKLMWLHLKVKSRETLLTFGRRGLLKTEAAPH